MGILGDLFTIALVLLGLWTFTPRRFQDWSVDVVQWLFTHSVRTVGEACRVVFTAITPLAYKLVTGRVPADLGRVQRQREVDRQTRERERAALDYGNQFDDEANEAAPCAGGALPHAVERIKPRADAESTGGDGGVEAEKEPLFAPITPEELQQLGVAIRHKYTAAKANKAECIKAGWGLTKSGSDPRYKRASQLFDLATQPQPEPEPYPTIAEDRKQQAAKRQEATTA